MKYLAILLLASVGAWGQNTPCPPHSHYGGDLNCFADDGWVLKSAKDKVWAEPAPPLKCGKYERVEHKMAEMTCLYPEGHPERCPAPRYIDSCAPIMHEVTEKEWQELQEWRQWVDRLRKLQCPSLSWSGGKCLPFCDERGVYGSCAHRAGKE